ncbi:hypothetical protein AAV32_07080 [Kerstersia gyiorum]|uniref:Uncharacterized protein n=1 Tax=Kerstersia gyiorum TaxID=206506 RepID=A0A171KT88_9BURK|nr:hypothetical protein AAV32_07080 [Kerstersia gyiorum]
MLDTRKVFSNPRVDAFQRTKHALAQLRDFILDAWRHFGKIVAFYQAISFKVPQGQRQHALGDAFHLTLYLGKSQPMITRDGKAPDDLYGPFVTESRADSIGGNRLEG